MRFPLWLSLVTLAGCMDSIPHEDPTDVAKRKACTMLENVSFSSLEPQRDCGLAPTGPVSCNWNLVFSANDASSSAFQWTYSDVIVTGHVSCDDSGAIRSDDGTLYEGHFDDATLDLVWDDVAYAPR